jgi:tellurite resistance protein TerC
MVFMAIFASFGIKGALQHRILYWGIIGALVFRALFVAAGTGLFSLAPWVGFIFAAVVAWSGWKMLTAGGDDDEITDYSEHWSVKMTEKMMPIFPRLHAERFFVTRQIVADLAKSDPTIKMAKNAAVFATPAFLCLMAIETSDIMFAFDSVPAVIAVTQEPLLVYAAMIFAVLGLRSLYFVLAALTRYLVHLEKAVIALLFFIAFKLTLQSGEHVFGWDFLHISPNASLLIVLGVLAAGVVASFIWPGEKDDDEDQGDKANQKSTTGDAA